MGGTLSPLVAPKSRLPRRDSESNLTHKLPAFREPQLATLTDAMPQDEGWLFEMKYDGYRCLAAIAGSDVRLYTRNGNDWTKQFSTIVPPLRTLTKGTLLIDGEVCAIDARGRTNFSLLKTSIGAGQPLTFVAFDLLEQDGRDLSRMPQIERKQMLDRVIGERGGLSPLQYSHHIEGHGEEVFTAMCAGGYEGTIAKRADAPYRPGERSLSWLKLKCVKRQEFVVVGWRGPEEGGEDVRSLILATYENGQLVHRGRVGTGFTDRMRIDLRRRLMPLRVPTSPLASVPGDLRKIAKWVEPVLVAEVQYAEITPDGSLRHPSFQGLREDKDPHDVHLEKPL